jgi:hypothetical protein
MLVAALSIQLLVYGRCQGWIAALSKTFLPVAVVAAGVAIVVPPRYNPRPTFYLAFGLTIYALLIAGAILAAVLNMRNHD